jgi:hypothetical protein
MKFLDNSSRNERQRNWINEINEFFSRGTDIEQLHVTIYSRVFENFQYMVTWRVKITREINLFICVYSGTCAIQYLSFPTSCDFRQEFQVPKYFFYILC